jgi:hypothetical protein
MFRSNRSAIQSFIDIARSSSSAPGSKLDNQSMICDFHSRSVTNGPVPVSNSTAFGFPSSRSNSTTLSATAGLPITSSCVDTTLSSLSPPNPDAAVRAAHTESAPLGSTITLAMAS